MWKYAEEDHPVSQNKTQIEILAFSDHGGIELEININQIPNKWKLSHAVCTVPTGPLGRPHSGVQKDTLYSGLGMVSPPQ